MLRDTCLAHDIPLFVGCFYGAVSTRDYIASNGRITEEWWIGKDLEGGSRGLIELLSRHLPGGAERNHEKCHSEYPVSRPRSEQNISWVRVKCVTATPTRSVPRIFPDSDAITKSNKLTHFYPKLKWILLNSDSEFGKRSSNWQLRTPVYSRVIVCIN
jgi:hypothetical protein